MRAWRYLKTRHARILADQDSTLIGISGSFDAAFTSPALGAIMVFELGPAPPREWHVAATIPQAIASSIGFVLFYSIVRRAFLDSYALPPCEFAIGDMVTAVGLGVLAGFAMVAFVVIPVANRVSGLVRNRYASGLVGGEGGGLVSAVFPLTLGAGQSQLGTVIDDPAGPASASASVRRMMSSTRRCRYQRRPVPARRQDDGRNSALRSRAHRPPRPDQGSRYAGLVYFASGGIEA